jgi:coenzyme F420-0:L-glutamate ligase/coenzyme F420-1:gamma-L-glutamate ligase
MMPEAGLLETLRGRRSVRRFDGRPVPREAIEELVAVACLAPAPHHSRPWRFLLVSPPTRARLAEAMTTAWRRDLEADGAPPEERERLLTEARRRLASAPALLLACLDLSAARPWPDERRRRAERDMFVQSLGAALQNLMLLAHARGLASCLMGAPLFCQEAIRQALTLPGDWEPLFLVELGYPDPSYRPRPRPEPRPGEFLQEA